jgi:hypothetical protein
LLACLLARLLTCLLACPACLLACLLGRLFACLFACLLAHLDCADPFSRPCLGRLASLLRWLAWLGFSFRPCPCASGC